LWPSQRLVKEVTSYNTMVPQGKNQ